MGLNAENLFFHQDSFTCDLFLAPQLDFPGKRHHQRAITRPVSGGIGPVWVND